MERFLGLPSGAWKKRRLFALRVLTDAHDDAGISRGALIVVEPGARATPGRLVLVRRDSDLTIQKVEYDGRGRTVIASAAPGALPFPTDSGLFSFPYPVVIKQVKNSLFFLTVIRVLNGTFDEMLTFINILRPFTW